jgi:putative intracellular protease/amidase
VTGAALAVSLVPVCITIVQRLATCFLGLQMDRLPRKNRAIILIAPDFDEEAVVHCLCQMRRRGAAVDLVGNPANWVSGASGLAVHPDYSLAQLNHAMPSDSYSLLIIPGGSSCATTLLSDPRVHRAIKRTFAGGGFVAAMSAVVPQIFANIGLLESADSSRFLVQGSQSTTDFVRLLIGVHS